MNTFLNNLTDRTESVCSDISFADKPLLVAFGGIGGNLAMPPFEFFTFLKKFDVNKIFIRDLNQSWYHKGLTGLSSDIESTTEYLKRKVEKLNANRTVFIGNSMGGFGAILFGTLLGADIVHAFSPQTFIGKYNRLLFRDKRWPDQISRTHQAPQKKYFDLKKVIKKNKNRTKINIHFHPTIRIEKIHAKRLCHLKNVILHYHASGGYALARHLRDIGKLEKIISDSF